MSYTLSNLCAFELRLSLLEKRLYPLEKVLGASGFSLKQFLEGELLLERISQ
jgi:hypothetical protein